MNTPTPAANPTEAIAALVDFFQSANQVHVRLLGGGTFLHSATITLAERLGVDMTADRDTIEMALRHTLETR